MPWLWWRRTTDKLSFVYILLAAQMDVLSSFELNSPPLPTHLKPASGAPSAHHANLKSNSTDREGFKSDRDRDVRDSFKTDRDRDSFKSGRDANKPDRERDSYSSPNGNSTSNPYTPRPYKGAWERPPRGDDRERRGDERERDRDRRPDERDRDRRPDERDRDRRTGDERDRRLDDRDRDRRPPEERDRRTDERDRRPMDERDRTRGQHPRDRDRDRDVERDMEGPVPMSNSNSHNSVNSNSHSNSSNPTAPAPDESAMSFKDRHYRPAGAVDASAPAGIPSDAHTHSNVRQSAPRSPPAHGGGARGRGNGRRSPPPGHNPNPNNIPSAPASVSMSTYPDAPGNEFPGARAPLEWADSHRPRDRPPHDREREPRYPGAASGPSRGGFDGERRGYVPREGREREPREGWSRERDAPPHQFEARKPPEAAYDARKTDGAYDARRPEYARDVPPHVHHSNNSSTPTLPPILGQPREARDREPAMHRERELPVHRERELPIHRDPPMRELPMHRDQPEPPRSAPILSAPSTLTLHPHPAPRLFRLRHSFLFLRAGIEI
ncbi:hypothetical protein B0H11DRAFT_481876 [Mycena galericulata]|nr:hypothetical protein B0H11DRAFT_481876 [Mycena galericulata]